MSTLSDDDIKRVISYARSDHKVFMIIAPTASGKTTRIPKSIHSSLKKIILVSLPTKIAASSASNYVSRVAKEQREHIKVDYMTREHVTKYQENDITYAVSGSVVNRMYEIVDAVNESIERGSGEISGIENLVIILDEVHTGSLNNSLILALWRYLRNIYTKNGIDKFIPKMILMTATPVTIRWLDYDVLSIGGSRSASATIVFLDDSKDYETLRKLGTYEGMAQKIRLIHHEEQKNERKERGKTGHILAFVPGKAEVMRLFRLVDADITNFKISNIKLYTAYGDMETDALNRIMERVGQGIRKVIIATNIVESSVTIGDVKFIVDSMLERRAGTSSGGGINLEERLITKNGANQRMGRAGRTIEGGYYHSMITKKAYGRLDNEVVPEIQLVPIHTEIITMLSHKLSPTSVLRDVLSREKIKSYIGELEDMDMLRKEGHTIIVTSKGLFAGTNRQNVRSSAFIWDWVERYGRDDMYVCVLVSCIIDLDISNLISVPYSQIRNKSYSVNKFGHIKGPDSFTTVINLWNLFISEFPNIISLRRRNDRVDIKNWCEAANVSYKVIIDIAKSVRLQSRVYDLKMRLIDFKDDMLKIISIFNLSHRDWKMARHSGDNYKKDDITYSISSNIPYNDDGLNNVIIGLSTIQFGNINRISLFIQSTYVLSRYTRNMILGSAIAVEPAKYELSSQLMNVKREEEGDNIRIKEIKLEQLGFNRATFVVPQVLLPFNLQEEGISTDVVVPAVSSCLVPSFVKIPTKTILKRIEEEEEDILDDDELMSRFEAANDILNIMASVGNMMVNYKLPSDTYAGIFRDISLIGGGTVPQNTPTVFGEMSIWQQTGM